MSPPKRPAASLIAPGDLPEPAALFDGVNEAVWIEVIQKMDEVYNDLIQYEVALEEKNAELEQSHQFINSVLSSMSDVLIVCDRHGSIVDVNAALRRFTGLGDDTLNGASVFSLFAAGESQKPPADSLRRAPITNRTIANSVCARQTAGPFPSRSTAPPGSPGPANFPAWSLPVVRWAN